MKLHWKKSDHPRPGEVWSTHRSSDLWLIIEDARVGWVGWAFDMYNLETGVRGIFHVSRKYEQVMWKKHS